ncbi:metallophosphoesterase [Stylonychia lemnae]|uniref:Metallophosphoesterase n=1 Tax=Stylonychia lemnae TaxID=5949 RepID=A0A078B5X7_STYLE|nr:metallophosphoesterase [Stylonychia lemnae]|eukprot:CDW89631.1 metallophosphoesterase [Stylonychia lemnae]
MRQILKDENPDLVVSTGDNVFASCSEAQVPGWYASKYSKFVQPMIDLNIPWAITTGNHDIEGDLDQVRISALDRSYMLSQTLPPAGDFHLDFNYILPIYDHNGKNIAYRLWFLDSGADDCLDTEGYDCFRQDQINWVKQESTKISNTDPSKGKGMMLFHIPLQQYMSLVNENEYYGLFGEWVCCQEVDTGMFKVIQDYKTVDWITCGHDHNNDYYGQYQGLNLAYGRKTGYMHYGPSDLKHGARVFEIQIAPIYKVKTWIRNEDSTIDYQSQKTKKQIFLPNQKFCGASINSLNFLKEFGLDKWISQKNKQNI